VRTVIVLAIGLVIALAFVFAASHLGKTKVAGAILFIAVWLIFCAFDYSQGLKAGYAAVDELGIHLILLIIPAFGAWAAARFLP
jgi:hypothetical protein